MSLTRESTMTLMSTDTLVEDVFYPPTIRDQDEMDIDAYELPEDTTRVTVATDFGTTFSCVAFAKRTGSSRPEIHVIDGYPHDQMTHADKPNVQVPTESWYADGTRGTMPFSDEDDEGEVEIEPVPNYMTDSDDEIADDNRGLEINKKSQPTQIHSNLRWGYEVQKMLKPELQRSQMNLISKSKLLLNKGKRGEEVRKGLDSVLKRLKRNKLIVSNEDVITDYLVELFTHAKSMMKLEHGITDSNPIEHVFCVPAGWEPEACLKAQNALEKAILRAEFGTMDGFFLVSEPEAAAARVLEKSGAINEKDKFLILDAGGGTVDATIYEVAGERPLRLSEELVPADGCSSGSSLLNDEFRKHLEKRLMGSEELITQNGYTVEGILHAEVQTFEKTTKRTVDVMERQLPRHVVKIQGIKRDDEKRLVANGVSMNREDFYRIFRPCLRETYELMASQLKAAKAAGHEVKKVLLVGGFGASKSLRSYLRGKLEILTKEFGYRLTLITSTASLGDPETDVVCGAIIRAWDKTRGPGRFTKFSYGFDIKEVYDPTKHKAKGKLDPLDGVCYVDNTLTWVIIKGLKVPEATHKILLNDIFPVTRKYFTVSQNLWVSSSDPLTSLRDHLKIKDPHNKGARKIGVVEMDMTPIIAQGLIQPVESEPGYVGKPHYRIEFELVMKINGLNLSFEIHWPVGGNDVQASGQVCIAAAFKPGTS